MNRRIAGILMLLGVAGCQPPPPAGPTHAIEDDRRQLRAELELSQRRIETLEQELQLRSARVEELRQRCTMLEQTVNRYRRRLRQSEEIIAAMRDAVRQRDALRERLDALEAPQSQPQETAP